MAVERVQGDAGKDLAIRRALASDAPALTALMQRSSACAGACAAILERHSVTPRQVSRDALFPVEARGVLRGFHSVRGMGNQRELDLMFVADAAQGRGVGALLFRHARDTARSLGAAAPRIVAHPPAEGFYRRMGARRIGTVAPRGRVAWPRPILQLDPASRSGPTAQRLTRDGAAGRPRLHSRLSSPESERRLKARAPHAHERHTRHASQDAVSRHSSDRKLNGPGTGSRVGLTPGHFPLATVDRHRAA